MACVLMEELIVKTYILLSADSGFSLQKYLVLLNASLIHVQYSTKNAFGKNDNQWGFFFFILRH